MDEVEIFATFDSEETTHDVARALNAWFHWVLEGNPEHIPEFFENFGVNSEDYAFDRDAEDVDWPETPRADAHGNRVQLTVETTETIETLMELLEALGAYEIMDAAEASANENNDDDPADG